VGARATANLTPDALHEGPPGLLHGGFSAALLDALLGTLIATQGLFAYTANLQLRYLRGTVLDEPVEIVGEVTRVVGRKVYAEGWISQYGRRTVEAQGVFVEPSR
jgi:acyl-coenzyme A thioesterase PaaI-like protein